MGRWRRRTRFYLRLFDLYRRDLKLRDLGNGIEYWVGQDVGPAFNKMKRHKHRLSLFLVCQFGSGRDRTASRCDQDDLPLCNPKFRSIFGVDLKKTFVALPFQGRRISGHGACVVMNMNSSGGQLEGELV